MIVVAAWVPVLWVIASRFFVCCFCCCFLLAVLCFLGRRHSPSSVVVAVAAPLPPPALMVFGAIQELASGFEGYDRCHARTRRQQSRAGRRRRDEECGAQFAVRRCSSTVRVARRRCRRRCTSPASCASLLRCYFCRCCRCEKKVEIDFRVAAGGPDLRAIPRATIDAFLSLAKCTVISTRNNDKFNSYLLSESSLFIFPTKIILKTCGTTLLLKSVGAILVRPHALAGSHHPHSKQKSINRSLRLHMRTMD